MEVDTVSKAVEETEEKENVDKARQALDDISIYLPIDTPVIGDVVKECPLPVGSVNSNVRQSPPDQKINGQVNAAFTACPDDDAIELFDQMEKSKLDIAICEVDGTHSMSSQRMVNMSPSKAFWRTDSKIIHKINSEPILNNYRSKKVFYFENPAFKNSERSIRRTSFADVVTDLIQEPIKCDIHPYGRGPLYRKALGGEQPQPHSEEGKLIVWVFVTIAILSVAICVIAMSQMYRSSHHSHEYIDIWNSTIINSTKENG